MLVFQTTVDYDNFDFSNLNNSDCLESCLANMYNNINGTNLTFHEIEKLSSKNNIHENSNRR